MFERLNTRLEDFVLHMFRGYAPTPFSFFTAPKSSDGIKRSEPLWKPQPSAENDVLKTSKLQIILSFEFRSENAF